MTTKEQIIEFLRSNQMSTEEVSDAMGKIGALDSIAPIKSNHYMVGEVQYVYAHDDSNWSIHEQIRDIESGKILYVDAFNVGNYAIFGELVSLFIIEKKGATAIILNGKVRDLNGLIKRNYPIWCKGITPIGCFNKEMTPSSDILESSRRNKEYFEGTIAVCDDSGVVIIPKSEINASFLERLQNMNAQEKIWFDCVENKDWNTYDTVCLKKYRNE